MRFELTESLNQQVDQMHDSIRSRLETAALQFDEQLRQLDGVKESLSSLFKQKMTKIKVKVAE